MTEHRISELIAYAEQKNLIEPGDRIWAANRVLDALKLSEISDETLDSVYNGKLTGAELPPLNEILQELTDDAVSRDLCED
ncbi:MAG: hypothetical protein IKI65_04770, partial [Firmicutes bacterium]|nr:hypothetical protein [Bacillota bacterium]